MRNGNILEEQDKSNDARNPSPSLGGYTSTLDVHHARIGSWFD